MREPVADFDYPSERSVDYRIPDTAHLVVFSLLSILFILFFRNRVKPSLAEWIAPDYPPHRKRQPHKEPALLKRLYRVLRAGRNKPAARRLQRRYEPAVQLHEKDHYMLHRGSFFRGDRRIDRLMSVRPLPAGLMSARNLSAL